LKQSPAKVVPCNGLWFSPLAACPDQSVKGKEGRMSAPTGMEQVSHLKGRYFPTRCTRPAICRTHGRFRIECAGDIASVHDDTAQASGPWRTIRSCRKAAHDPLGP